jgi:RNA polymerase sigma-70 factor, ECF subfamily
VGYETSATFDTMIDEREPEVRAPAPARIEAAFRRLAQGDPAALEDIYTLEADRLYALALWITGSRDDAADAVQDVFVKLAGRRTDLSRVRRPRAYLLAMARSAALDRRRGRVPRPEAEDRLLEEADPNAMPDPHGRADARLADRWLRRLPLDQREAIYLRYYAELSFAEIGRVTGVSLFTAASRCRLGLAKLRRQMGVAP